MNKIYNIQGQEVINAFHSSDSLSDWISDSISICETALATQMQKDGWLDKTIYDSFFTINQDGWDINLGLTATMPKERP